MVCVKKLQLTPSRIECNTSLVDSNSSLDILSRDKPTAAVRSTTSVKELNFGKYSGNHSLD